MCSALESGARMRGARVLEIRRMASEGSAYSYVLALPAAGSAG